MSVASFVKKLSIIAGVLVVLALATFLSAPRYPLTLEPLSQLSSNVILVKGKTEPGAVVVIEDGRETVWTKANKDTGEFTLRVYLPEDRPLFLKLLVKDIRGTIRRAEFIPLEELGP